MKRTVWGTNLASTRSLRAPCTDAEMRTVAVYCGIPVRGHDMETVWRRCTSAAAFQRFVAPAWLLLLTKKRAEL